MRFKFAKFLAGEGRKIGLVSRERLSLSVCEGASYISLLFFLSRADFERGERGFFLFRKRWGKVKKGEISLQDAAAAAASVPVGEGFTGDFQFVPRS